MILDPKNLNKNVKSEGPRILMDWVLLHYWIEQVDEWTNKYDGMIQL